MHYHIDFVSEYLLDSRCAYTVKLTVTVTVRYHLPLLLLVGWLVDYITLNSTIDNRAFSLHFVDQAFLRTHIKPSELSGKMAPHGV